MIRPTPAENFRRIWNQKKRELNLTQTQAAEKLGWTQGAFSQYLNNLTDLGPATVLKLANFLGVPPTDIDPTLKEILPKKVEYPIRQTATGKPRESDTIRFLQPADKDMFVIYLDKAIKVKDTEVKELEKEFEKMTKDYEMNKNGRDNATVSRTEPVFFVVSWKTFKTF